MDLLSNSFEFGELNNNDFNLLYDMYDENEAIKKKNEWVIRMRLKFCPIDMIHEDGTLNQEYFKPVTRKKQKAWTEKERKMLIKGIEKYGIGNWDDIRQNFLPEWDNVDLKNKTIRMMGRQSLVEYSNWKGDEKMIEFEYQRNKYIGTKLNHWKGGVLVNDEDGQVKKMLSSLPLPKEYTDYLNERKQKKKIKKRKKLQ